MRNQLLALAILIFSFNFSSAQDDSSICLNQFTLASKKNIQIVGEESTAFTDALFTHFDKKYKAGITRIKNVEIEGLDEPITLQVHQGYYGKMVTEDENSRCSSSYFHTFSNIKDKEAFQVNKKLHESECVTIYLKRGRDFGVTSDEEFEIIQNYLLSIYSKS